MAFSSRTYWEDRYASGGNAGAGSFATLGRYKSSIVNHWVWRNRIGSVVELGCGDGETASLFQFPDFVGIDVSPTAIARCKALHANKPGWSFRTVEEQAERSDRFELALSLDVIYHLVEDDVFQQYMETLFGLAEKWVMIYSSDFDGPTMTHVRHRWFSRWVALHRPDWSLVQVFQNPYPFHPDNPDNTTFANFSVFRRIDDSEG